MAKRIRILWYIRPIDQTTIAECQKAKAQYLTCQRSRTHTIGIMSELCPVSLERIQELLRDPLRCFEIYTRKSDEQKLCLRGSFQSGRASLNRSQPTSPPRYIDTLRCLTKVQVYTYDAETVEVFVQSTGRCIAVNVEQYHAGVCKYTFMVSLFEWRQVLREVSQHPVSCTAFKVHTDADQTHEFMGSVKGHVVCS